jgi:16S rRNA (guanine1207-N2)-methyltransferase
MADHYFTQTPASKSDVRTIEAELRGMRLKFFTDAGVFSRSGVDFGSALLIESMQIPEASKVLDVGCGYGPIGITAAKLHPANAVDMIDINERAVELAKRNAEMNGVRNVRIWQSDLYEKVETRDYDVILSNPPIRAGKQVVFAIFSGAYDLLKDGGSLWIVIQKKQGAPSAFEKLQSIFPTVEEVTKEKGYRIYRAVK